LWSSTIQVPVGDLFRLQDELTSRIVESLAVPLTSRERRMLKQDVPSSPRAYELYLRATEMSRDSRHWQASLDLYEQCAAEDPDYAPAFVGIGRLNRMIGKYVTGETGERFSKSEAALRRALELNPDLSLAESLYSHLEVDLGRAEQSMVRLLRRARERSADPEVFAGLSHAMRYCGLLQASLVASKQARRLDPKIRTSVSHTLFMLGDYEGVVENERQGDGYMRGMALTMLGRQAEALAAMNDSERPLPHLLSFYAKSLECIIRNDFDESRRWIEKLIMHDPEGRYYLARQYAYIGDAERALSLLGGAVDDGFLCVPAFARDPWLDSVRGTSEFAAILRRAETRHRQAVISFLTAEGDRILGIPHPV
jgi:tetratricopeptide (TPR) repeat protein